VEFFTMLLLGLLGLGVSILSAVTGIGGGGFYTPVLHFIVGLDIKNALAVSSAGILVGSGLASAIYLRRGVARPGIALPILAGQLTTSAISTYLTVVVPKTVIYIVLAGVLLYNAKRILMGSGNTHSEARDPPTAQLVLIGLVTGLIAPLAGIGGGIIIVPSLVALYGLDSKVATASSLLVIAPSYILVTSIHIWLGNMLPEYALPLVTGILLGSILGTMIHRRSGSREIRILVGLIALAFGIYTLIKLIETATLTA